MIVAVTGGRDYSDGFTVRAALDKLHGLKAITVVREGGAFGADRLAREWARSACIPVETHNADWAQNCKAAGPIRNRKMLRDAVKANLVLAFPGGRGTNDCVYGAHDLGIRVLYAVEFLTHPFAPIE